MAAFRSLGRNVIFDFVAHKEPAPRGIFVGDFLNSRVTPFSSSSKAESPHILLVLPIGDEFRQRIAFKGTQEKFRKCLTQGVCDNQLGWRNAGANGPEPGAEGGPNELGKHDRKVLEQALGNDTSLDVDMISMDLPFDLIAVV